MQSVLNTLQIRNSPSGNHVNPANVNTNQGLDPLLIQSFPTFPYSSVKDFRREKYGLECAICLSEFEDESILKLLNICYHVFHQECIDLWLEMHKTCPVCRRELDMPEKRLDKSPLVLRSNSIDVVSETGSVLEDAVSIFIKEDDRDNRDSNANEQSRRTERLAQEGGFVSIMIKENETWDKKLDKLSRSRSTGHSVIGRNKENDDDKHTLRLPEHVRLKLLRGGHHNNNNWPGSCIPFGDYSENAAAESSAGPSSDKV